MSKQSKIVIGAAVAIAAAAGLYVLNARWISPATTRPMTTSGQHPAAPNFSLADLSGKPVRFSDFQGKVVLLDFWATWCGPCQVEIPEFEKMQERYRDQGFTVLGISMDDGPQPVMSFYRQFHMNYPVVMGNSQVSELYGGILGLPTTFVIGRDGRIYNKHTGMTGAAVFNKEVQELLAAKPDEAANFKPAGAAEDLDLGSPGEANPEVPGVDITKLSATELTQFKKQLEQVKCTCGCKYNLLECRLKDTACAVSRKMARDELKKFKAGAKATKVSEAANRRGKIAGATLPES